MTLGTDRGLLGSSAVMAAGTVVSRITGFVKASVIAATIGLATVTADTFNVPNVIPTTLYILVGGGVLNSVLVPVLVRSIKEDADGGEAYSQRLFSVVVVVLGAATIVSILTAPWIVAAFVSAKYRTPELEPFFDNMVLFARFCFPQIFFYGLYVLIGQMLNARGRFGPMMWAPIINNVVAISVFASYLLVVGPKAPEPFSDAEILYLGIGSTCGVALQALALVPVLRRAGFRMRLRTDWRRAGLARPARLGLWTIAFVLVNQVAYLFVVRAATGGSAGAFTTPDASGAGFSVYANAMLIMMVPHSVITVSLGTALLPRLSDHAADGNLGLVRDRLDSGIRICLAVIVPVAALLAALSVPLVALLFDHGAARGQTAVLALTVTALVPGLIAFTVHYLVLRGFYAVQDTRTPFFVQLWVAGTMVISALLIGASAPPRATVLLAIGYSVAYVVGAAVSMRALGRRLRGLRRWALLLHIFRLAVPAGLAAAVAFGVSTVLDDLIEGLPSWVGNLIAVATGGSLGLLTFIGIAYVIKIGEVREAVTLVRHRLSRTGPSIDRQPRGAGGDDGGNYP